MQLSCENGPMFGALQHPGVTWWLTPHFSVSLNYRYITLDKGGYYGNSQGINSRALSVLE